MKHNDLAKRVSDLCRERFNGVMKKWSLQAGLNETAVRDVISKGNPTYATIIALSKAAGVSPAELAFGEPAQVADIPIVGIASAGDGWTNQDDGVDTLEFSTEGRDLIAIEIRGDSMFPVYRDGDYLICERRHGSDFRDFLGCDCVIKTKDGEGYVKKLLKGSKPGRFDLKSYNISYENIRDTEIAWAAPVKWVKRCAS